MNPNFRISLPDMIPFDAPILVLKFIDPNVLIWELSPIVNLVSKSDLNFISRLPLSKGTT